MPILLEIYIQKSRRRWLLLPDHDLLFKKQVKHTNRQLHKNKTLKGGVRKRYKAPYLVKGFRLFGKVHYQNQVCFILGRRKTGSF